VAKPGNSIYLPLPHALSLVHIFLAIGLATENTENTEIFYGEKSGW
jgi:hypothetical protein